MESDNISALNLPYDALPLLKASIFCSCVALQVPVSENGRAMRQKVFDVSPIVSLRRQSSALSYSAGPVRARRRPAYGTCRPMLQGLPRYEMMPTRTTKKLLRLRQRFLSPRQELLTLYDNTVSQNTTQVCVITRQSLRKRDGEELKGRYRLTELLPVRQSIRCEQERENKKCRKMKPVAHDS